VLLATTFHSIYRSIDDGVVWTKTADLQYYLSSSKIIFSPGDGRTAYLACQQVLMKTVDGGFTWSVITLPHELGSAVYDLAIDPQRPSRLYAASSHAVISSDDGGATWTPSGAGFPPNAAATLVVVDPGAPSCLYASCGAGGIYKSQDGGASWTLMSDFTTLPVVSLAVASDGTLYALVQMNQIEGIWAISKTGLQWVVFLGEVQGGITCFAVAPTSPPTVYAGTGGSGLIVSADGGRHYSRTSLPFNYVRDVSVNPDNGRVYAATPAFGIYRSSDGGRTWFNPHWGPEANESTNMVFAGSQGGTLFMTTVGGVLGSTDDGATWTEVLLHSYQTGGTARLCPLASSPKDPDWIIVDLAYIVVMTKDGGASWEQLPSAPLAFSYSFDPADKRTIYALNMSGLFVSADAGASWGESGHVPGTSIAIDPTDRRTRFVGNPYKPVYKSTDGGSTWHPLTFSLASANVLVHPSDHRTVWTAGSFVFPCPWTARSTDGGEHWERQYPPTFTTAIAIDPSDSSVVYLGTQDGAFVSRDSGATWNLLGLSGHSIAAFAFNPSRPGVVYVGTDSGIHSLETCSPPSIILEPQSMNVLPGSRPTLSVKALGGTLSYQWFRGEAPDSSQPVQGATSPDLVTDPIEATSRFWVRAYDEGGSVDSTTAVVSAGAPVSPPSIQILIKQGAPFRISVGGTNLQPGIRVFIDGNEWTGVVWKNADKVLLSGGASLKNLVPKGTSRVFRFVNPDGGEATTSWSW
jgi:photosystem II stability/assembly factor-like uncharacterized protein